MTIPAYPVRPGTVAAAILSIALLAPAAPAQQWTVTNLQPASASSSGAFGVSAAEQVGRARVGGVAGALHASAWSGSALTWLDLHPALPAAISSTCYATNGAQQVGVVFLDTGLPHAGLWTGTAASWIDLNPAGATDSAAYAVSPTSEVPIMQQAGFAIIAGVTRAGTWSGSAATWVDLHPAGAASSYVYATTGSQQSGYARIGNEDHACMWTGTPESWVDLNPAGSTGSGISAASGNQQAGFATIGGVRRAGLWTGTAASWVDLHPIGGGGGEGATESQAYATNGVQQAGHATLGGNRHACVWSGSAATWVDLHAYLPATFRSSDARGIWTEGSTTYIAGFGYNTLTSRDEALLWVSICQGCPGDYDCDGEVAPADIGAFINVWFTSVQNGTLEGDFDHSGAVDPVDIATFIGVWFAGVSNGC
ncbi:MAG: hypothetical protein KF745_14155 [Phycisphaeraceae bacterium]|nr:hypothetical protein [Phycisphaeraceae bacterium]